MLNEKCFFNSCILNERDYREKYQKLNKTANNLFITFKYTQDDLLLPKILGISSTLNKINLCCEHFSLYNEFKNVNKQLKIIKSHDNSIDYNIYIVNLLTSVNKILRFDYNMKLLFWNEDYSTNFLNNLISNKKINLPLILLDYLLSNDFKTKNEIEIESLILKIIVAFTKDINFCVNIFTVNDLINSINYSEELVNLLLNLPICYYSKLPEEGNDKEHIIALINNTEIISNILTIISHYFLHINKTHVINKRKGSYTAYYTIHDSHLNNLITFGLDNITRLCKETKNTSFNHQLLSSFINLHLSMLFSDLSSFDNKLFISSFVLENISLLVNLAYKSDVDFILFKSLFLLINETINLSFNLHTSKLNIDVMVNVNETINKLIETIKQNKFLYQKINEGVELTENMLIKSSLIIKKMKLKENN